MSGGMGTPSGGGDTTGEGDAAGADEPAGDRDPTGGAGAADTGGPLESVQTGFSRVKHYVGDSLRAHFGVDARGLAAFRISLGTILLVNLLLRARFLSDFYTDAGLLPSALLAEIYPGAYSISIHGQFPSIAGQLLLFAIAGGAAIALLVGYHSTTAAIVSLYLVHSLNGRNPLVINGGDLLLRQLVFWTIFLPVSERWSVDALRRSREPRARIASLATAGLFLQMVAVYTVNAVMKHRGETWQDGTATQFVFQLDQFTVLLGDLVAEATPLVKAFGLTWYWLVTLSLLLVVLRGWPRAIFASMFVGGHASMALTMQLGLFPFISITGLLVFYPVQVWNRVERYVARPLADRTAGLRATVARVRQRQMLPRPSAWLRGVGLWRSYVVPFAAAIAVLSLVIYNVGSVTAADMGPLEATDMTNNEPRWNMFAPNPLGNGVWYVMEGTTESGERVDAFRGGEVTREPPPDMAHTYPTARWRKYFSYVDSHRAARGIQRGLASYLCGKYEAAHGERLDSVTIVKGIERISLEEDNTFDHRELAAFDCQTGERLSG